MTLVELLIALVVVGTLSAVGLTALRGAREMAALDGAADAVTRQLLLGRNLAVTRREPVRFLVAGDEARLLGADGATLAVLTLGRSGELPLDSIRTRPSAIRFNARGHAGAGSVYLWKGRHGIRIVCNFLGRLRRESIP